MTICPLSLSLSFSLCFLLSIYQSLFLLLFFSYLGLCPFFIIVLHFHTRTSHRLLYTFISQPSPPLPHPPPRTPSSPSTLLSNPLYPPLTHTILPPPFPPLTPLLTLHPAPSTGNMLARDVEEFIAHGADVILGKPLKISILCSAIKEHFKDSVPRNWKHTEHSQKWFSVIESLKGQFYNGWKLVESKDETRQ